MQDKKQFIIDIIKNTIAFGIYMVAFHVCMMPFLAAKLDPEINAQFILYVMISNIVTLSIGNELGILFQILTGREIGEKTLPDIRYILNYVSIILGLLMFLILIILRFSIVASLILALTTVLTNFRLFLLGYLRLRMSYKVIIIGNFLYLTSIALSIIFLNYVSLIFWMPILLAEVVSILFYRYSVNDFFKIRAKRSKDFHVVLREFFELLSSTLLTNIPNYADKILVLPLLGDVMMAAYYAGSVVSNLLFIIVNPINGVILAWLSKDSNVNEAKTIINNHIKVNIIIIVIVFCLNFPSIYLMSLVFYKQYIHIVIRILVPLSLNATFSISASLLKMVYLRYLQLNKIKYFNLINLTSFIVFSAFGSKLFGVVGFAYGASLSKVILWCLYLFSLLKANNIN